MKNLLERGRYLVLLPVGASLVAAAATFVWGVWKTVLVVQTMLLSGGKEETLTAQIIELMDKFLIGGGLYIFAVSLYELFIDDLELPAWLVTRSLDDVKRLLVSVVILVMAVTYLERLMLWQDPQGTLQFGLSISAVTAALIVFLFFSGKRSDKG